MSDQEPDDQRQGLSKALIKITVALGASESKMRWRFQRLENWWRRSRRKTEQRVEQVRYKNKICPSCRSINNHEDKRCSECDGRLGSRAWQVLDRIGLVVPSVVSASTLLGICFIAVYARLLFAQSGDSAWSIDNFTLLKFGANYGPITLDGEQWRLLSSIVSHAGLVHLGFNLIALYIVGPEVEKLVGRFVMPLLFAATGVAGALASAYLNDPAVGIGASGGIMGLIGFAAIRGHLEGTTAGRMVRDRLIKWVLYTFILGFAIPGIDNLAHGGGLIAGAGLGYLIRPELIRDHPGRRIPLSVLGIAAAVAAVWLAVAPPPSVVDKQKPPGAEDARFDPVAEVYLPVAEACGLDDAAETRRRLEEISARVVKKPSDWCAWIEQVKDECKSASTEGLQLQQKRDFERICLSLGIARPTSRD